MMSRLTLWPLNFKLFPLVGSSGANVKSSSGKMLLNPFNVLKHSINFPLSLRLPSENRSSSLSLSSYDLLRRDGISLVALLCTDSSLLMSLIRYGSQNCTACCKCGLTRLLYNGNMISLLLKVKFLFMNPSIQLAFFDYLIRLLRKFWILGYCYS